MTHKGDARQRRISLFYFHGIQMKKKGGDPMDKWERRFMIIGLLAILMFARIVINAAVPEVPPIP